MREMIEYVKKGNKIDSVDRHGNPIKKHTKKRGMFLAFPSDENPQELLVGWSLCNKNAGDRFNKVDAYVTAHERAYRWSYQKRKYSIPNSLQGDFFGFVLRALRYFKGTNVSQWVCDYYECDFNEMIRYEPKPVIIEEPSCIPEFVTMVHKTPNEICRMIGKNKIPGLQLP